MIVDSNTVEKGEEKLIVVQRKANVKPGNSPFYRPRDRPRYLHFTLFKENTGNG
jgi:hypothetical protein